MGPVAWPATFPPGVWLVVVAEGMSTRWEYG